MRCTEILIATFHWWNCNFVKLRIWLIFMKRHFSSGFTAEVWAEMDSAQVHFSILIFFLISSCVYCLTVNYLQLTMNLQWATHSWDFTHCGNGWLIAFKRWFIIILKFIVTIIHPQKWSIIFGHFLLLQLIFLFFEIENFTIWRM